LWKCSIPLQGLWHLSRSQTKASVFGKRATHRAAGLSGAVEPAWSGTDLSHGAANCCTVAQSSCPELARCQRDASRLRKQMMCSNWMHIWSFVQKKEQKRWLWTAMCRRTRQIVAFVIGDREPCKLSSFLEGDLGGI
jgi:hypothetical protein